MDRIEQLKEYLEKSPADSFLKHALALEYIKIGDDISARELFESIVSLEPSYIGTYYHLGKLFERLGETTRATALYEKGMIAAKQAGDLHALNELRMAFDDLSY